MFFRRNPLKAFERTLGRHKVLTAEEDRITYSYDTTDERCVPQVVVLAETVEDVQTAVEFALDERYMITPRGAGTGMSGGSVPLKGGMVLCTERMNDIIELDPEKGIARVSPGLITAQLQDEAAKHGLFYPPDPSSHKVSTMGGNVAENAGGLRCVKYGVTKHYVLGLEFITSRAEVCRTGILAKSRPPCDLTPLLIGSEGTLGIITEIALRLIPAPVARGTMRIFFPNIEAAGKSVTEIMAAGIAPSVTELMDKAVLDAVTAFTGTRIPSGSAALLLLEVDGDSADVQSGLLAAEEICRHREALEILYTQDPIEAEKLWKLRRSISPSLARLAKGKINEDVSVPRSKLPELLVITDVVAKRYGLNIPCFGHAGDGNLHINVMFNPDDTLQKQRALQAVEEIFKETIKLGGTISGEHGIGYVKRNYLRLQMSSAELDTLRIIKEAFDPEGLFNPGKILPE
ncbi:MAG: FAD-linked oxidase C-terminal domain-containing protein [bacterium]